MDWLSELVRGLLRRRETAGLLIGVITLIVIFIPKPLFAIVLLFISYIFGYELELITGKRNLRWVSSIAFLFSLISVFLGLLVAFVSSLIYGYLEVAKRGYYSHATYHAFTTAFLSAVYGGVLPYSLVYIKEHSHYLLLALVLSVWAADTFAYYIGKKIGKTRLVREISPNKTLEGFLGGIAAGVFVGIFVSQLLKIEHFNPLFWFVVVKLSILGDLFESFLKRSFGVKDSSNLLGSHGGFLDRFDALLLASLGVAGLLKV